MKTLMACLLALATHAPWARAHAQDALPAPAAAAAATPEGAAGPASTDIAPIDIAMRLLDRMDAGDYAGAEAMFDAPMAEAVPAATLKAVWESLPAQAGAAKGRGTPQVRDLPDARVVLVPLHHERVELVAQVVVNPDGRISGFVVKPAEAPASPAAAPPADASYAERDIAIGDPARALPGTLALPRAASVAAPVAAVVLVHGSGPHDRDETIGPNRPFLDIARGLAERGIATLRYDKRTRARPQDFSGDAAATLTIDSETTDDAVAAVEALRAVEGIDPARIFVLGHSQGGMLAPRIAVRSGHVAGLVLLAAPARPLLDILVEQNRRLAVLGDGRTSDAERAAIATLEAQVRAARTQPDAAPDALPLNLPAGYWRSVDAVDAVADAQAAARPMLVLQGARDIQVVDADWQAWKAGLHGAKDVTFKLYPALNHLGIAGQGEGSLAEYMQAGHVDATLVSDIAGWIDAH